MIDLGLQPDLRSPRLWLTPFTAADAAAVYAYGRNPRVARHTTWSPHESIADAEGFIEMVQGYVSDHCWAIRLAPHGEARGAVEFGLSDPSRGAVHYVLTEELWGRGLMTEAVRTVLDWAFQTFEALECVATSATSANVGSRRVLEKCGFRFTGLATEDWPKFDEPVELAEYELTRRDWTSPG